MEKKTTKRNPEIIKILGKHKKRTTKEIAKVLGTEFRNAPIGGRLVGQTFHQAGNRIVFAFEDNNQQFAVTVDEIKHS